jgi:enoyl-CoA hydratase/carnithine racemase
VRNWKLSTAADASEVGILDAIVEDDLRSEAIAHARRVSEQGAPP